MCSNAFLPKTTSLPCVCTAFVAEILPFLAGFQGIRYALAPLGPRRLAPTALAPWDPSYPLDSSAPLGSKCLQSSGGDEDCLFVNVYAPAHALPASAGGQVRHCHVFRVSAESRQGGQSWRRA